MCIHEKAIKLFLEKIEGKTGWGKVELKTMLLECILEASSHGDASEE